MGITRSDHPQAPPSMYLVRSSIHARYAGSLGLKGMKDRSAVNNITCMHGRRPLSGLEEGGGRGVKLWGWTVSPRPLRALAIFSSSSGQMSGQCVKPKYTRANLPSRSLSVNGLPSWLMRSKGPPIDALPTVAVFTSAPSELVGCFRWCFSSHMRSCKCAILMQLQCNCNAKEPEVRRWPVPWTCASIMLR